GGRGAGRHLFSSDASPRCRGRGAAGRRPWGRKGSRFMSNRNLLRQYDLSEDELRRELEAAFDQPDLGKSVEDWLPAAEQEFETNKIVRGRVIDIVGDDVLVDVGYKSEG